MKWAFIGAKGEDTLEFHLKDSLEFLGHEVKIFDITLLMGYGGSLHYWLGRISDTYETAKARILAKDILTYQPDVVLGTYRFIHPLTIDLIKASEPGIVAIHVNPDALINLEQQQVIASNYDFLFTKDPYMVKFLRDKAGLNAYYLPEAFNPRFHTIPSGSRKELEEKENTDILFFGNLYPYRARVIEQIIKLGYNVKLFGVEGPYFPNHLRANFYNRIILGSEKSKIIWGAKIVLNNLHYAEIEGVNCKYFEINGVGGFQICDFKETLREYSPVDPAKYSFNTMDEAEELIHYYLSRPEERYEIANLHHSHFLANHTYEHRVGTIIDLIKERNNQK